MSKTMVRITAAAALAALAAATLGTTAQPAFSATESARSAHGSRQSRAAVKWTFNAGRATATKTGDSDLGSVQIRASGAGGYGFFRSRQSLTLGEKKHYAYWLGFDVIATRRSSDHDIRVDRVECTSLQSANLKAPRGQFVKALPGAESFSEFVQKTDDITVQLGFRGVSASVTLPYTRWVDGTAPDAVKLSSSGHRSGGWNWRWTWSDPLFGDQRPEDATFRGVTVLTGAGAAVTMVLCHADFVEKHVYGDKKSTASAYVALRRR